MRKGCFGEKGFRHAARRIANSGRDDTGYGVGLFYFHTPGELRDDLCSAGFDDITVHGVEGPAWPLLGVHAPAEDPLVHHVLQIAELADTEPAAVAASAHVLAFATR